MSNIIINRPNYIETLKPFIGKDLIKVFVGQRRVGKSYLLKLAIEYIKSKDQDANIISIDKEQYEFDSITDYHILISYVEKLIQPGSANYLFVDEIQEINEFEKALRHFQNKQSLDIYCTGSNAKMLSGDLATLLSGRFIQIEVHSLNYTEFLEFNELNDDDESLQKYLKWGGLPFIRNLEKRDDVIFDYLKNILSTIIYKDIVYRYKIRNVDFFDRMIHFIAANSGNLITARRISEYLKSQHIDISLKVVLNYLELLQNAFLVYKLKRVDLQSKRIFEINNKYFFEDWGLRNALLGLNRYSVPDVIENVVFMHLLQLNFSVQVGLLKEFEIDFVASKDGKTIYIQVAYLIVDQKVKEREFGNLLKIKDNYPKLVISLDPYPLGNFQGIQHMHLREFLKLKKIDFNVL